MFVCAPCCARPQMFNYSRDPDHLPACLGVSLPVPLGSSQGFVRILDWRAYPRSSFTWASTVVGRDCHMVWRIRRSIPDMWLWHTSWSICKFGDTTSLVNSRLPPGRLDSWWW